MSERRLFEEKRLCYSLEVVICICAALNKTIRCLDADRRLILENLQRLDDKGELPMCMTNVDFCKASAALDGLEHLLQVWHTGRHRLCLCVCTMKVHCEPVSFRACFGTGSAGQAQSDVGLAPNAPRYSTFLIVVERNARYAGAHLP
jgi:hypothetical protein